jgi:hypothetical protein
MGSHFSGFYCDVLGRFDGPLHFRLYMQPLMAVFLAWRDGREDARAGRSAFGWTLLTDAAQRRYLIHSGWKGISRIFLLAYALDVVYQLIVWHGLKPMQALPVATLLAVIPYALLRGPFNRLLRHPPERSVVTHE